MEILKHCLHHRYRLHLKALYKIYNLKKLKKTLKNQKS